MGLTTIIVEWFKEYFSRKHLWLYVPQLTTTMPIQLKRKIKYATQKTVAFSLARPLPDSF